jgi:hypothetical protein
VNEKLESGIQLAKAGENSSETFPASKQPLHLIPLFVHLPAVFPDAQPGILAGTGIGLGAWFRIRFAR